MNCCKSCQPWIYRAERAELKVKAIKKELAMARKRINEQSVELDKLIADYNRLERYCRQENDKLYLSKLFAAVQWGDWS